MRLPITNLTSNTISWDLFCIEQGKALSTERGVCKHKIYSVSPMQPALFLMQGVIQQHSSPREAHEQEDGQEDGGQENDVQEVQLAGPECRTTMTLPAAMQLYNLFHSELVWELKLDTRCLMGWSQNVIVLSFRGTASMTNAWSDLQVSIESSTVKLNANHAAV